MVLQNSILAVLSLKQHIRAFNTTTLAVDMCWKYCQVLHFSRLYLTRRLCTNRRTSKPSAQRLTTNLQNRYTKRAKKESNGSNEENMFSELHSVRRLFAEKQNFGQRKWIIYIRLSKSGVISGQSLNWAQHSYCFWEAHIKRQLSCRSVSEID